MKLKDSDLCGFDLETTGVDPFTAKPVSFAIIDFRAGVQGHSMHYVVNPGEPIPAEAIAVHGITNQMASASRWTVQDSVAYVSGLLLGTCSRGGVIVGMNVAYDLTVLKSNLLRIENGPPWRNPDYVVDLMVLDKHVDQYRKGKRTLSALCDTYGVEHGGAHDAAADTIATVRCLEQLIWRYPEIGNMSTVELIFQQRMWHREQQQSLSDYFVSQGQPPIPSWHMRWPVYPSPSQDELLDSVDPHA